MFGALRYRQVMALHTTSLCTRMSMSSSAASRASQRHYFYKMDTRGRLFLADTKRMNMATSLKDLTFLDFFFKRMKRNDTEVHSEYPYVSVCGRELNFISPPDKYCSLVFYDFIDSTAEDEFPSVHGGHGDGGEMLDEIGRRDTLIFGANNRQNFDVAKLAIHLSSGRLYHKIDKHGKMFNEWGLLHPSIAEIVADRITYDQDREVYSIKWDDRKEIRDLELLS